MERKDQINKLRGRLAQLRANRQHEQMNHNITVNNTTQVQDVPTIIGRNWNIHQQAVSLSVDPFAPITYEVEVQCELTSRTLDIKTQVQQGDQNINTDLLQPREKKLKKEKQQQLAIQPIKTLSEQQITSIIKSKHFGDWFDKSTKVCEKVLDYGEGDMMEDLLDDDIKANQLGKKQILSPSIKFYDQHYTHNRIITALDWSIHIPELLLASYSQNQQGNIKDHVGVLLLWSLNLKNRPQFHCFCQSPITSAKFFPYYNSTILGGCYNGQLLLWDLRSKSLPVQRTGLSSQGHKYPVYTLNVVGTQIANTIVSMSNDGKLCVWDIRSFSNPVRQNKPSKDINVTCSEFPQGDVNNYYYGTQNSVIYKESLHATSQVEQKSSLEGHNGSITGLSVNNPYSQYSALSGLLLSSSYDWSIKLWSPKTNSLIRTFEYSDDYIYDVDWHPQNPSLFASCNNQGNLNLWDLTGDLQIPLVQTKVVKQALNKCMWNLDGSKIMTGDSKGTINVFDLDKKYQRINPNKTHNLQNLLLENPNI